MSNEQIADNIEQTPPHCSLLSSHLSFYFRVVTLGAFTWKNEARIGQLFDCIRNMGGKWLVLHFLLLTVCLNFPVTLAIARLSPFELYSRLYGEQLVSALPENLGSIFTENLSDGVINLEDTPAAVINEFNAIMLESGYGAVVLMPILVMAFGLTLIIQAVFYLCAVSFLRISRMYVTPLSFRSRIGLALFSSTLPVLGAALFGLYLPTVHIIIYYFIIIFFIFQRSRLCPNG